MEFTLPHVTLSLLDTNIIYIIHKIRIHKPYSTALFLAPFFTTFRTLGLFLSCGEYERDTRGEKTSLSEWLSPFPPKDENNQFSEGYAKKCQRF